MYALCWSQTCRCGPHASKDMDQGAATAGIKTQANRSQLYTDDTRRACVPPNGNNRYIMTSKLLRSAPRRYVFVVVSSGSITVKTHHRTNPQDDASGFLCNLQCGLDAQRHQFNDQPGVSPSLAAMLSIRLSATPTAHCSSKRTSWNDSALNRRLCNPHSPVCM